MTSRFSIAHPLCALRVQGVPTPDHLAGVRVRLYEYRDDLVIEHLVVDATELTECKEIPPLTGPEIWIDIINGAACQRCVIATFTLEKGD